MALTSCCCCDLRTGSLSIGITFLVLTVLAFFGQIPGWVSLAVAESAVAEWRKHPNLTVTVDVHAPGDTVVDLAAAEDAVRILTIREVVGGLQTALSLLFNSLLVHGVLHALPGLVLAWLICYAIAFCLCSLGGLALVILGIVIAAYGPGTLKMLDLETTTQAAAAVACVAGLLVLGLAAFFWYLWAVVLTHWRELTAGGQRRDVEMADRPPPYQSPTYKPVPQNY